MYLINITQYFCKYCRRSVMDSIQTVVGLSVVNPLKLSPIVPASCEVKLEPSLSWNVIPSKALLK